MTITETALPEVKIITPDYYDDYRGWFAETYNEKNFAKGGISVDFIQDNQSFSYAKGTVRGIHYQLEPKAQSKLVRCTAGSLYDIAVDLRKDSPNFKKWVAVVLSRENKKQLFIPKGFGHCFVTLTDNTEAFYKTDEYWSKENERCIRYDDPDIGIDFSFVKDVIITEKDKHGAFLKDAEVF
jgi:dTDP-4-dehydrorhamnose 3,5-epimerase